MAKEKVPQGKVTFEEEAQILSGRVYSGFPLSSDLDSAGYLFWNRSLHLGRLLLSRYQAICFPVYGRPKVARGNYFIFDRGRLKYLTWWSASTALLLVRQRSFRLRHGDCGRTE